MRSVRAFVPRQVRSWVRSHAGPLGSTVRFATAAPVFALTYDDGPDPAGTPGVLDALQDSGASATFFMLTVRALRYPALVAEVVAAGHEVALHGRDHRPLTSLSPRDARRNLGEGRRELEDLTQHSVTLYRPPYGAQSISSFRATAASGLTPLLWSGSATDSREAPENELVARALRGARPGTILLCHDAFADTSVGGRRENGPQLDRGRLARRILSVYAEAGLAGRPVGEVARIGTAVRELWFSSSDRTGP